MDYIPNYNMHTITFLLNNANTYVNPSKESSRRSVQVIGTEEEVNQLITDGYLQINDLFDESILQELRKALDRVSAAEIDNPKTEHIENVGHYVRYLLDKDKAFHALLFMERPLSLSRAVLGPQIYLNVEARIVPPKVANMGLEWHIHHRLIPEPLPPFFCYPHALHGLLYLDDVDQDTGPICLLPGSHLQPHLMKYRNNDDQEGQAVLPVKAGTCVLMHANLWHRTLPTTKNAGRRRLILFAYTPSWIKPDVGRGVIPQHSLRDDLLYKNGSAELRELLGEFYW